MVTVPVAVVVLDPDVVDPDVLDPVVALARFSAVSRRRGSGVIRADPVAIPLARGSLRALMAFRP